MRAALALVVLALGAPAHAGGFLQAGTGMRPLGLPLGGMVGGGGLRLGMEGENVGVFVGGMFTKATIGASEDEGFTHYVEVGFTSWTAQAGARLRIGGDELARPYVVGGALLFGLEAGVEEVGDDWENDVVVRPGPGGFVGGGADVRLARAIDLGVEVGGVHVAPKVGTVEKYRNREDTYIEAVNASWLYADVHITLRWGAS